jgi:hypothetical protein
MKKINLNGKKAPRQIRCLAKKAPPRRSEELKKEISQIFEVNRDPDEDPIAGVEVGKGRDLSREGVGVRRDRGIDPEVATRRSQIKTPITENTTKNTPEDPTADADLTQNPSFPSNSTFLGALLNVLQFHAVKTSVTFKRTSSLRKSK